MWLGERLARRRECNQVGTAPSQPPHNLKREKRTQRSAFLFWSWLVESRIHLIFLDALRRITALSEVLLFRAVAYHSKMDNGPGSLASFLAFFGSGLSIIGKSCVLAGPSGDHPTRGARKASGSEFYSSDSLGSPHCDPELPLLQVGGGDATIVIVISALTSRPIAWSMRGRRTLPNSLLRSEIAGDFPMRPAPARRGDEPCCLPALR